MEYRFEDQKGLSTVGPDFFLCLQIVTFSKCIESNGKVDGEMGVLAEKISSDF